MFVAIVVLVAVLVLVVLVVLVQRERLCHLREEVVRCHLLAAEAALAASEAELSAAHEAAGRLSVEEADVYLRTARLPARLAPS